jgi:hypothetical protein
VALCSYYRKFVKDFARIASPLTKFTKKNMRFTWGTEQKEAFDALKNNLISTPILAYHNPKMTCLIDCDASNLALGCVLSQFDPDKGPDQAKVIAYGSKTLSEAEKKYDAYRRELLSIVFFTEKFRDYLEGKPFIVRTDHRPLEWIKSQNSLPCQLARWALKLESYQIEKIIHRAGKQHTNADPLSRRPDKMKEQTQEKSE